MGDAKTQKRDQEPREAAWELGDPVVQVLTPQKPSLALPQVALPFDYNTVCPELCHQLPTYFTQDCDAVSLLIQHDALYTVGIKAIFVQTINAPSCHQIPLEFSFWGEHQKM